MLAAANHAARAGLQVRVTVFRSHSAVTALLDAGLRVTDEDTLMVSRPDIIATGRYVPHADLG